MAAAARLVSLLLLLLLFSLLSVLSQAQTRPAFACGGARTFPFCQTSLPIAFRVRDLVQRLTLDEKTRLLVNNAIAVPRLGISGYEWWSEALHGVSNVGPGVKFGGSFPAATSFPQVITTAASFNESLWKEIGQKIELRVPALLLAARDLLSSSVTPGFFQPSLLDSQRNTAAALVSSFGPHYITRECFYPPRMSTDYRI
ncbi:Beta-D-xylosidase 1 [Asimina triloba]